MCCVKIAEIIITATRRRRAPPVAAPPALPLPVVIAWLIGLAIFILYLRHGLGSRRPVRARAALSAQCPQRMAATKLQRVIASAGELSRRAAQSAVLNGKVSVNGKNVIIRRCRCSQTTQLHSAPPLDARDQFVEKNVALPQAAGINVHARRHSRQTDGV